MRRAVVLVLALAVACSSEESFPRQADEPPPTPTLVAATAEREEIPPELADQLTRDILDAYTAPRSPDAERLGPAADYIDAPTTDFDRARGQAILDQLVSGDETAVRAVLTGPLTDAAADFAAAFAGIDAELAFAGGVLPVTPDGAAALVELTVGDDSELHNVGFRHVDGQWYLESFR